MTRLWPHDGTREWHKRYKTIISSADGLSDRIIIRIKNVNFIFLVFMTLFYDILTQQIKKMKELLVNDTAINGLTVFIEPLF